MFEKLKTYQYHLFLVVCIGLISFISFNLGKISSNDKGEIRVGEANVYSAISKEDNSLVGSTGSPQASSEPSPRATAKPLDMRVIVSKNSDKYHYTWCASANRIKEENKIWFNSDKEAEARGYILAGNCSK